MKTSNAIIKEWTLRESECYLHSLELVLILKLQVGGCCCFYLTGVYKKKWEKNQLAYAVKRLLEITEADSLKEIKGKPIRTMFKNNGGIGDIVIGIGHLLNEDWLIPREDSMWNDEVEDD